MFTPMASDDPAEISGYQLRARLGAGGMGQVYLSFTPGGRPVALKIIRQEYANDRDFRERFAREVRAAQRVNGVYTAQLLDAGPDAPTPWLASTYVPGPTLLDTVRTHGPLPVASVRPLVTAVALSLQAIHAADVVHRDLTPRNVMLAADGPRVIDFGIARAVDTTHVTISHTPVGTPAFMAPEQANGERVTPAADVFSLGAVAYFAATGRSAFGDGNYLSVLRRVADAKADLTGCPPELRPLIEACLVRNPADRPSTAQIVAAWGGVPRLGPGWLPPPVTAMIQAQTAALSTLPPAPPRVDRPGAANPANPGPGPARRRRAWLIPLAAALVALGMVGGAALAVNWADRRDPDRSGQSLGGATTPGPGTDTSQPPVATSTAPPTPTTTPTGTTPASAPAPQWTGVVRITDDGIDLDLVPPVVKPTSRTENDVHLGLVGERDGTLYSHAGPTLFKWTGAGIPTPAQCAELVSTQGAHQAGVAVRDVVCLITDKKRTAVLVIKTHSNSFTYGLTATATVWPNPDGS
ncbi:serine/threonine-protein kinase [Micromonospora sonneratiae]|uniref:Protein kinase n=1 Tax=Micromonospora sonneratiae TaxID=1184706 RepID=A0ABW3Y6V9_9ACTN